MTNYRRNEDRWPVRTTPPTQNRVLDVSFDETASVEHVLIADVKQYIKITHTEEDTLLPKFIKSARQLVEKFCGISIVQRVVTAILTNEKGNIELPYGPIQTITSVKDIDDVVLVTVEGYQTRGISFLWLESPTSEYVKLVYTAGYATAAAVPAPLIEAIILQSVYRWKNRNDEVSEGLTLAAKNQASPYKRTTWLL